MFVSLSTVIFAIKVKNLLLLGVNISFQSIPFRRRLVYRKANKKSQKLSRLSKIVVHPLNVSIHVNLKDLSFIVYDHGRRQS